MLEKIKTFGFQEKYTRYEKNVGDKIVHLKKIYKLTLDHFFIGVISIVFEREYYDENLFYQ